MPLPVPSLIEDSPTLSPLHTPFMGRRGFSVTGQGGAIPALFRVFFFFFFNIYVKNKFSSQKYLQRINYNN